MSTPVVPPETTADPVAQAPSDTPVVSPATWQIGAGLDEHPTLQKFKAGSKTLQEYAESSSRSYIELEKKIGQRGIIKPSKTADASDVRRYFTETGCPEKMESYTAPTLPDGEQLDQEFLEKMKAVAWNSGVPDYGWQKMTEAFIATQQESRQQSIQRMEQDAAAAGDELRKDWGAAYGEQLNVSVEALKYVLAEDFDPIMNVTLPDGSKLGNNPAILRRFAKLGGEMFTEGSMAVGVPHQSILTPESAKAEIATLEADSDFQKRWGNKNIAGHQDAVDHRDRLYALAYPGGSKSGSAAVGPKIAVTGGAHVSGRSR